MKIKLSIAESKIEIYIYYSFLVAMSIYIFQYHLAKPLFHLAALATVFLILWKPKKFFSDLQKQDILWVAALYLAPLNYTLAYWQYNYELDLKRLVFTLEISFVASILYLKLCQIPLELKKKSGVYFLNAVSLCGLLGGLVAVITWWQSGFTTRVTQGTNLIIIFAIVISTCAMISLYGFVRFIKKDKLLSFFYFLSFLVALTGSIASGSKGPWLAILIFLSIWCLKLLISGQFKLGVVFFIVMSLGILCAVSIESVNKRISQAYGSLQHYFLENQENAIDGSVGIRIEQWKAAMLKIQEKPVLGYGSQPFENLFADLIDQGEVSESSLIFGHVHNSYMQSWLIFGVSGLVQMLILLLLPVAILNKMGSGVLRDAGIILVIIFSASALTDDPFLNYFSLNFYLLSISFLLACTTGDDKTSPIKNLV